MPLVPSHTLLQAYSLTLAASAYFLLTSPLTLLNAGPLSLLGESMHLRPALFSSGHEPALSTAAGGVQLSRRASLLSIGRDSTADLPPAAREILALLGFVLLLAALTLSVLCTTLRYSASELSALVTRATDKARPRAQRDDDTSQFAEKLHTLHTSQTLFISLAGLRVFCEGALIAVIYLRFSERFSQASTQAAFAIAQNDHGVLGIRLLANRVTFTVVLADMLFWGYLWTVLRDEAREKATILKKRWELLDQNEVE